MGQLYGLNAVSERAYQGSWDPRTGYDIQRRWMGPPAKIDEQAILLQTDGIAFSWAEAGTPGGYQQLVARVGSEETQDPDEPLSDLWDQDDNDMQVDIWQCPPVKAELLKLYSAPGGVIDVTKLSQLARLKADIEGLARGEVVTYSAETGEADPEPLTVQKLVDFLTALNGSGYGLNIEVWKKIIRDISMGVEGPLISQCVVRNVKTIPRGSNIKPVLTNRNKIYLSTTVFVSTEGVPTDAPFDLPDGVWLKKGAKRPQISADKWQIIQEYWHADSYSDLCYELAVTS